MPDVSGLLNTAINGAQSNMQNFQRWLLSKKQAKLAAKINPIRNDYQVSPYAQANVNLAQNQVNGRMAGAGAAEDNIQQAQANTIGNLSRNATSGSQLLALAAGAQGTTDNAYAGLAAQEAQNQSRNAGMLMNANEGMINEGDKMYQDRMQKYLEDKQAKDKLTAASIQNRMGTVADAGNGAVMSTAGLTGSMNSGFDYASAFGGGRSGQMPQMPYYPQGGNSMTQDQILQLLSLYGR